MEGGTMSGLALADSVLRPKACCSSWRIRAWASLSCVGKLGDAFCGHVEAVGGDLLELQLQDLDAVGGTGVHAAPITGLPARLAKLALQGRVGSRRACDRLGLGRGGKRGLGREHEMVLKIFLTLLLVRQR